MEKPLEIRYLEHEINVELFISSDENIHSSLKLNKTVVLNQDQKVIGLNLSYCKIKSLKPLIKFIDIEYLYLAENDINDINLIKTFPKLKLLDLNSNKIDNIDSLSDLNQLEKLYLQNNKISRLPIINSENLKELFIGYNELKSIENLKLLKNLFSLNLDNNKINDINVLTYLKKLKYISIASNELIDLSILNKFKSLIILDLSKNYIEDIRPLRNLEIINKLSIRENRIYDLSPLYFTLKKNRINFISAYENPLIYPPHEIAEKGVEVIVEWFDTIINIANSKISINKKDKNPKLDIGKMGLTDLGMIPKLFELDHLKELIISNERAEFDWSKNEWERIDSVNNGINNNIVNIPDKISKLINLERIFVGGDWKSKKDKNYLKWRINDISNLCSLKKLSFLNVSNNQLENISDIVKLENIEVIHLNNNKIIDVPKLDSLINLREIYLSNNLIDNIDFLNRCYHLITVDLHSNLIKDLIPLKDLLENSDIEIKVSSWEKVGISVRNNSPDINPPYEVLNLSKKDFFLYLKQLEYESKLNLPPYYNREIKVVLVGNSYSGKSTLLNYLKTKRFKKDIKSTHWLVTEELKNIKIENEELKLRFFDFGGQDYYHDTHKMFFSSDSMYILIWDAKSNLLGKIKNIRDNSNEEVQVFPLEYWLDSIKIFAKKSLSDSEKQMEQLLDERDRRINLKVKDRNKGNWINDVKDFNDTVGQVFNHKNILVVQNKIDIEKDYLNQPMLINEYSNIYDFVNVSILDKSGVAQFHENYIDILKRNLNYKRPLLITWGIIKDNLKEVFEEVFIINKNDFKKRINDFLSIKLKEDYNKSDRDILSIIFKDDEIILLASFLNEIGLVIFNSENENVNNIIVVNQNKFLEVVSIILNLAKNNKGEINETDLLDIEYSKETIQILICHNIIFKNIIVGNYIAPLFLPEEPNFLVDLLVDTTIPYRRFKFDGFIPKSIILSVFSEISTKENVLNDDFYFWKNGLIFKNKRGCKILLKFDIGLDSGFASIDVFNFERDFNNSFAEEIISVINEIIKNDCNGYKELVSLDGKYYVDRIKLIFNYKNKINYIEAIDFKDKKTKYLSIFKYNDFMDDNLKKPAKKIFISYSKYDEDYRKEFVKHLVTLRDEGLIDDFTCEGIDLGDNSHKVIQKNLSECDYMIALVSVDYLNTEYIRKFEIEKAKELGKKIIPIIIKPCDWENSIIKDFHASLRGTNISLDKELFLNDEFKETSKIERNAWWTKIIKEFRAKLFAKVNI